jgi:hypothetical protein
MSMPRVVSMGIIFLLLTGVFIIMLCVIFLEHGADVNTLGGDYGGALQAACYDGPDRMIQNLLDVELVPVLSSGPLSYFSRMELMATCKGEGCGNTLYATIARHTLDFQLPILYLMVERRKRIFFFPICINELSVKDRITSTRSTFNYRSILVSDWWSRPTPRVCTVCLVTFRSPAKKKVPTSLFEPFRICILYSIHHVANRRAPR